SPRPRATSVSPRACGVATPHPGRRRPRSCRDSDEDRCQVGATRLRHTASAAARPASMADPDMPVSRTPATQTPVFVDGTGRRRRRIRRVAYGLLIGACAYGALVIASLLGGPVPPNALLPLPGGQRSPISAGKATSSAHPATTAKRAGTGNATTAPGSGPTTAAARSASSPTAA